MGGRCWRALPPPRYQGGILERLVVAPGCGLLFGGQGLFHVPQGPHADVIGVDDFSDAGACAERDPVGEMRSPMSGLPSLLWVSPARRRCLLVFFRAPQDVLHSLAVGAVDSSTHPPTHLFIHSFIHSFIQHNGFCGPRSARPWGRQKEHGCEGGIAVPVPMELRSGRGDKPNQLRDRDPWCFHGTEV